MALNDPAKKMSKSIPGSFVSLSDDDESIRKKVGRAVTDVGPTPGEMGPGVRNLFTLLESFAPKETQAHFQRQYEAGTLKYSELKPAVAEAMVEELAPIRARREELARDPDRVRRALRHSADRARAVARETMAEVRDQMGLRY
jgi:tryptophanyl-tRNA synthetase